ncbi:MAG: phospholipase [Actinomycetota bacterium]|nr:phospholipase [Actinomycetota bacterium]
MTQTNPHLLERVEHYGVPTRDARAVVVLVHGRTIPPEYMNEHVVQPLGLSDIAYVAPAASGNSWYPKGFLEPVEDNQPGIDNTMELLQGVVDSVLAAEVSPRKIVWCGFSQGACAVSQFVSLHPRRWGGLVAFTGGLIGPPGTEWKIEPLFESMPTYFSTSDVDQFVPEFRVRESVAIFKAAGAKVDFDLVIGRPHEISDGEIVSARELLLSV